jgi:hypothetical protein
MPRASFPPPTIDELAAYHQDILRALHLYFSPLNPKYEEQFVGKTQDEVKRELETRLEESDRRSSFVVLTILEASFRIDFEARCEKKLEDVLSRHFFQVQERGRRVRLDEDILEGWKTHGAVPPAEISELRGAFKFRHWFAHGRSRDLGRNYDFLTVRLMAERITSRFPFEA